MTLPDTQSDDRLWHWTRRLLTALSVLAVLIGLAAPTAIFIWRANTPTVVVEQGSAGTLLRADVHTRFYVKGNVTNITTSAGMLVVAGAFTGPIGTPLIIERTNKASGMRVCTAHVPPTCARLVGAWAGPMQPTADAGKVTNFVQHGWTEGSLEGWLGIGFAVTCMVVLAWVVALLIRERLLDDCDDSDDDGEDEGASKAHS
jgi:hypothetical protein